MGGIKPLVVAQGIADEPSYDAAMAQAKVDLNSVRCTLPFYLAYSQKAG
ncbi:MAG: hypothetical protein ACHQ4H_11165 [Ktedonobacterales bacterium]